MISSDRPLEYRFAVSKKLTPRSSARLTIGVALSISTIHSSVLPKDMVPKQIRETCRPVDPSLVYCIAIKEDSVIAIAFKRSRNHTTQSGNGDSVFRSKSSGTSQQEGSQSRTNER